MPPAGIGAREGPVARIAFRADAPQPPRLTPTRKRDILVPEGVARRGAGADVNDAEIECHGVSSSCRAFHARHQSKAVATTRKTATSAAMVSSALQKIMASAPGVLRAAARARSPARY